MYQITVYFFNTLSLQILTAFMQELFEKNGVAGTFEFKSVNPILKECCIVFTRNADEDGEYVLERIPNGSEINDASLAIAACDQLLHELTQFDGNAALEPVFTALRTCAYSLLGVETLRPIVANSLNAFLQDIREEKLVTYSVDSHLVKNIDLGSGRSFEIHYYSDGVEIDEAFFVTSHGRSQLSDDEVEVLSQQF